MSLAILFVSIIICLYFIFVTPRQYYLYTVTIFLYLLGCIGTLLKVIHLPGADELLIMGLMSELFAGTFLIISGIKSTDTKFKVYKIILGILLITHLVILLFSFQNYGLHTLATLYPCAMLLIAGWIIISKRTLHDGERNLLIVILMQSVVAILAYLKMEPLS